MPVAPNPWSWRKENLLLLKVFFLSFFFISHSDEHSPRNKTASLPKGLAGLSANQIWFIRSSYFVHLLYWVGSILGLFHVWELNYILLNELLWIYNSIFDIRWEFQTFRACLDTVVQTPPPICSRIPLLKYKHFHRLWSLQLSSRCGAVLANPPQCSFECPPRSQDF